MECWATTHTKWFTSTILTECVLLFLLFCIFKLLLFLLSCPFILFFFSFCFRFIIICVSRFSRSLSPSLFPPIVCVCVGRMALVPLPSVSISPVCLVVFLFLFISACLSFNCNAYIPFAHHWTLVVWLCSAHFWHSQYTFSKLHPLDLELIQCANT